MLLCSLLTNFNPRTHVGCDSEDVSSGFTVSISIHAPTWGATPVARSTVLRGLFQSTHPRGVRPSHITIKVGTDKFQSTHPRGVRPVIREAISKSFEFQSTHPRGVRLPGFQMLPPMSIFQSTHPRGVRLKSCSVTIASEIFQSTHPRGVRPHPQTGATLLQNFNPRTHVGCDRMLSSVRTE